MLLIRLARVSMIAALAAYALLRGIEETSASFEAR
jgi:hypothetical protein